MSNGLVALGLLPNWLEYLKKLHAPKHELHLELDDDGAGGIYVHTIRGDNRIATWISFTQLADLIILTYKESQGFMVGNNDGAQSKTISNTAG